MHESMARLFECARRQGPATDAEVMDALGVTSAVFSNWKRRGISRHGAIAAEQVFGCSVNWVLSGEGSPTGTAKDLRPEKDDDQSSKLDHTSQLSYIQEPAYMFTPSNLSAAIKLMAKLLQPLDKRTRKTMGKWLKELAMNPEAEAADIAHKAEHLARSQRISENAELNRLFSGNPGSAVETKPAELHR